ncbi:MAG: hypothetical protein PF692_01935 [Kiritimatiellae bacterium]|jgi:epoxyqueuosine reductase|nr:hypothetical protein [Kiritimatiellia bacterium]
MNSQELKNIAKKAGADLIGIASIDRFKELPAGKNPLSIFPECKSVIVVGRRILRGSLRGVEEGTSFGNTYGAFGFNWLEDTFLSKTTYDVTCALECDGIEAVPLFGYSQEADMDYGIPVAPGKPAPNVILAIENAAYQAGLGTIGKGGFFLTPEFGPRQRLAMILVDFDLEADSVQDLDFCDDCNACIDSCPLGAYKTDGSIDKVVCKSCNNGAFNTSGKGGIKDRFAASCGRACMISLEERNKLSNKFKNSFRKREPWARDMYNRPIICKK